LGMVAILSGCDGGCELGATWCEDDVVMVCVADEDDGESVWDETEEDEEDSFFAGLLVILELADSDTHSDVAAVCSDTEQVCVEEEDWETDEVFAFCDWPMGLAWMY
jgi:hypothetical protein